MPITSLREGGWLAAVGTRHSDAHAPTGRQLGRGLAHAGLAARVGRRGLTELYASIRHVGADVPPVARTGLSLVPPARRNTSGRAVHTDDHAREAFGTAARGTRGTRERLGKPAIDAGHA